jgi:LCP family protein required for cell wall assembly
MNRILEVFRKIKSPAVGARLQGLLPNARRLMAGARRPRAGQIVLWGIAAALGLGMFFAVRGLTACWRLTSLPGIPPANCAGASVNPLGTPIVDLQGTAPAGLPPPDVSIPDSPPLQWDGGSRINIAFFGLRGGEIAGEDCPQCTDTIIVFTVDPVSKTAGMISVPRDLYVNIPGSDGCSGAHDGFCRINTAWTTGEGLKLPGGGPGLAMKTVSLFLGVPIQYYVQVDFDTFVEMIKLIGGVDIYNDEDLILDRVGAGNDKVVLTCCGMRHLTGKMALAYARGRHTADGDVDRSKRQQKLILAIRDKVLRADRFPALMAKAPQLYNTFQAGIRTNMGLQDGLKLASLMKDVPLDQIQQGVIDNHMVNFGNVTLGGQNASVLIPIPDKIRELRDKLFTTGGPTSPIAQGDPAALMQADAARIEVTNNTYTQNLDQRTGAFLAAQGMQVAGLGPPTGVSDQTVVIVYAPKLYALRYLIQPLGMITSSHQIIFQPDSKMPVDLEIRLGNDWVSKLPAGY